MSNMYNSKTLLHTVVDSGDLQRLTNDTIALEWASVY